MSRLAALRHWLASLARSRGAALALLWLSRVTLIVAILWFILHLTAALTK